MTPLTKYTAVGGAILLSFTLYAKGEEIWNQAHSDYMKYSQYEAVEQKKLIDYLWWDIRKLQLEDPSSQIVNLKRDQFLEECQTFERLTNQKYDRCNKTP